MPEIATTINPDDDSRLSIVVRTKAVNSLKNHLTSVSDHRD